MVVLHSLLNIIDSVPETHTFDLPRSKQNLLKLEFTRDNKIKAEPIKTEPLLPFADSDVFHASIVESRRLTAQGECKAIYEVTLDVEDSNFKFKAGDTIGVIPHNDDSDVNLIITHLDLTSQADLCYVLSTDSSAKGNKIPLHVPLESTLRHVLTYYLDLRSVLRKLFLLALSKYTKDERERRTLEYLCSKEGSSTYTSDILNKGLCILDLFTILSSCKPPIEVLLANLPRLLPRPYSIVNSGLKNNKIITICFSVMTLNNRKGLTTGWIENLISNEELNLDNQLKNLSLSEEGRCKCKKNIPIYLRKNMSMFSLPEDITKSIIMIGPGTGVAPFMGFLEEREFVKVNNPEMNLGEAWLFGGCRNSKLDFIYEEKLNGYLGSRILSKLSMAFSRIDNTDIKHVQDLLTLHGKKIMELLNEGAVVFLCGDLKTIVDQVKEIFVKGFIEHGNLTQEEAKLRLAEMQKDKRFLVDAWS